MNTFFYRRDEYERLYNCTGIDPSKIGSRNVPLGSTYITIGICLEIMYIPCMIVLCKRELRQNSCFKLMFLLGLFDMVTIVFNSIITGYFTVEGATFCSHPTFIYFCGVSVMGLWCGTCLTSIILSLNRAIELWFPRITQLLFTGWRTYLWYLPPLSYAFVMAWISKSFSFSTRGYAWYNNPYVDLPWIKIDPDQYHSITHSINNLSTVFIIPFLYIALAVSVWVRCRYLKSSKISKIQKQLTYQSCALCFFVFMADAVGGALNTKLEIFYIT
ncbi:hypothetical protein QR680_016197 [Steinernema hermaphroditum]|uniref:Uncharacterized protein n=1 Tax=Steinernema hermaphroditum TaxID=289476 RepID=A0AA39LLK0_9BILA|nr:hypothetical protein QR680_016197 [Steinernema hermaphroditum]